MPPIHVLVPGDLESRTGGYAYDRRLIAGLRTRGWQVEVGRLSDLYPHPDADAERKASAMLSAIADDAVVLVDGLAFGAMPDLAARERLRLRLVALVHHPLAAETGLSAADAARLFDSERRALAAARRIVVTSQATRQSLAPFGVAIDDVVVAEPGTDLAPLAAGSPDGVPRLLCVGLVVPRKGQDVLVDALIGIQRRPWRLTCVGSLDRAPDFARRLRATVENALLCERIAFAGELSGPGVDAAYHGADLFVLPTRHEGYGMAIAESLARGIPVISTPTGAIPELVGTEGGVLVPPGDWSAVAAALERWLSDSNWRDTLVAGARRVRSRLPTWEHMVERIAATLEELVT